MIDIYTQQPLIFMALYRVRARPRAQSTEYAP